MGFTKTNYPGISPVISIKKGIDRLEAVHNLLPGEGGWFMPPPNQKIEPPSDRSACQKPENFQIYLGREGT